jgi:DNA-directed RNA polymerase specialized sigma24 family protein
MATSFAQALSTQSSGRASWCFLLLEYLDEFATLAWYLVADGKRVEHTFSRTMAELDSIPFEPCIPTLAFNQARDVLITQAIAVVSDARTEEGDDWLSKSESFGSLPDLPRLALMLRMIIRSSESDVAKFLGVSPSVVQALVDFEIERLRVALPIAAVTASHQGWVSLDFGISQESSTDTTVKFTPEQARSRKRNVA